MAVPNNIARFLARYSEGLRLTVEHGAKSGVVLEYAYRNQPQGSGMLGRWIDRTFLHLRAWEGVRLRIETTRETIAELVARRRAAGRGTLILDVASGTASYLRAFAREHNGPDLAIACHDRDPRQVTLGRQLVASEGLKNFRFSVGDATDQSSYLTSSDPDIVLAIGLFANLPRHEAVRTVMRLAFERLSPGGWFVCTTLADAHARDADAFSVRPAVRSPELIAGWLREAGFTKIDQRFSQPQGFALIGWKPDA